MIYALFDMITIVIERRPEFHICIDLKYVNSTDWCSAFDFTLYFITLIQQSSEDQPDALSVNMNI